MPIFIGTRRILRSGSGQLEPETVAFAARLTTPPSSSRLQAYNNVYKALKGIGLITKLDALYLLAANDSQAACQNLIQNAFNCTEVSTPTFTQDRGYVGSATTRLSTGFNPATAGGKFVQDSCCMGTYVNADVSEDRTDIGTNQSFIRHNRNLDLIGFRSNDATTTHNSSAIARAVGCSAWSRTASTTTKIYRNGVLINTDATASAALESTNITICTGAGSNSAFTIRQQAAGFFGLGLTDTEMSQLYSIIYGYLNTIGAA